MTDRLREVYIVDAARTPIGKYAGGLSGVRPDDLAAHVVKALTERTPDLDPARIDDVYLGNANGAGEENRDVARMAVLLAGLPVSVPGTTVNRLCGSGLEAVIQAARAIAVGDASVVLAGGVESMSRAPWVLPKPERPFPAAHQELYSTTLGWRMTNPRMPKEWTVSLGEGAELVADKHGITREQQDAFALASHEKAARAWKDGAYEAEVVILAGTDLTRDETIRETTSLDALARLKPAFRDQGTVTAGNASPLNDGAAALLLVDEAGLKATGREPLARIRRHRHRSPPWRLRGAAGRCGRPPVGRRRLGSRPGLAVHRCRAGPRPGPRTLTLPFPRTSAVPAVPAPQRRPPQLLTVPHHH
jgi:acetyl-CoA acetyltransferase family protein